LSNKIIASIVALALLVGVGVLVSSGDTSSTTRNAALVVATPCTKPGQVTKVSKQSVVCATTNTGSLWYATMKAKGKAQACKSPGAIRKKSNIVWVCGVVKKKTLWQATQPLPPAVVASTTAIEPGATQPTPALDSTQVATPDAPVNADNGVLADTKIPDDKIVTQVIEDVTTPPSTTTTPTVAPISTTVAPTAPTTTTTIPKTTTTTTPTTTTTIPKTTTTTAPTTTTTIPKTTTTTTTTIPKTCAEDGPCAVGDTGPGGGKVFYVASGNFTSTGSNCGTACKYLEAAPSDQGTVAWCSNTSSSLGVTAQGIGSGMSNTTTADSTCTSGAIQVAADYTNNSKTDWHLPSKDELNEMCKYARTQATGNTSVICNSGGSLLGGFAAGLYWSSSENFAVYAWFQDFYNGFQVDSNKGNANYVRPVRAF